jgi:hypothetical protein
MSFATLVATAQAEFRQGIGSWISHGTHQTGAFPSRTNTFASVNMDAILDALLMDRGKAAAVLRTPDAESTAFWPFCRDYACD